MLPDALQAQSPQDKMFPNGETCYARSYGPVHLARHPEQQVTKFAIFPDFLSDAPRFGLELRLSLRGDHSGAFSAHAICETEGEILYCGLEGDAGGFQVSPARNQGILVEVSSLGMTFENDAGFVTLERDSGDDRSFLLRRVACG